MAFCAVLVAAAMLALPAKEPAKSAASPLAASSTRKTSAAAPTAFNKTQFSTDVVSSLWTVVNKGRILPSNYIPAGLTIPSVPLRTSPADTEMHVRPETAAALEKMFAAAKKEGINLMLSSGYRSYAEQVSLYGRYAAQSGVQAADTFSARAGHSEHQTGLAVDIEPASGRCELDQCFADTPEGKWLAANAYSYGFIIRYPKGAQQFTGYEYEPWHARYVGLDLAKQIQSSSQTLEQFFGLPNYTDYPATSYEIKTQ